MERTDWRQVGLILAAGIIGGCQVGKIAIAVPLLREDMGLSLLVLAWVAGAYAALGLVGGLAAGFAVGHFPLRRVVSAGLVLIALGNLVGAAANGPGTLIASRILESIGFLAMVVSCPPLLRQVVTTRDQPMVFAYWSTYIPAGAMLMLLAGPSIMQENWRLLWLLNAALALVNVLALQAFPLSEAVRALKIEPPRLSDIGAIMTSPAPMLLAGAFCLHSFQWFALSTFLPAIVVDRLAFSLPAAGFVAAAALAANAVTNISVGLLLRLGAPIAMMMATGFAIVGICGFLVFSGGSSPVVIIGAACACLGFSGLLPATAIATMPRFVAGTQRHAIGMGLLQQATSIGQVAGPVVLAFWADWRGWPQVSYLYLAIAACGLVLTFFLHRISIPPDKTRRAPG